MQDSTKESCPLFPILQETEKKFGWRAFQLTSSQLGLIEASSHWIWM